MKLCSGLVLALAALVVQAQTVEDVRLATAVGHTRTVIDLSQAVEYKLFQLSHPDRVVIDLERGALAEGYHQPEASGSVDRVRTGRRGDHGLRLVLDLNKTAHPRSFLLEPGDGHGYRLVVDLYSDPVSTEEKAPALLAGEPRDIVVVVDAGHGGDDPGAIGPHGTQEEDITLKVAKLLAADINKVPGMRAYLTRDSDVKLELKQRYQIAREHNADLFISIHADAFRDKSARGSSVWVLSRHGKVSEAARWLANRQNNPDLVGGVSLDDKSDTLAAVLLDLSQGASIGISDAIARRVLQALGKVGPTHKNHVERANFVVLRSPDVPSILVETAFITNPHEERLLRSPAHRQKLARAILSGVKSYFMEVPPAGTLFAHQRRLRQGDHLQHVVANGETLSGIADDYGVSVARLQDLNHLANSDMLRAGAVLRIPAG